VSAPSGELDALLVEARAMSAKGRDTEAAQLIHSRVASLPAASQGRARFEEARLYRRAKVPDLALPAAREALRLGQKDPDLLWIEADCMRQLEQPSAEEKFRELLAVEPSHTAAKLGLARIRMRSEDPVSALPLFDEYFRAASPLDDDAKIARLEHARALKIAGRYQQAADRYAELLEVEPLESVYYSGLAEVLYRLKLRKEARRVEGIYRLLSQGSFEEHVEERLRETGNTAFALGQRAANRLRQKRYLDAFRSYLQALELDQDEPRFRMFYADLATQFRRLPEARKVLEVALERKLQPASGLWWMLGRVALEEKRWIDAASAFQKGLEALSREGDAGGTEKGQASTFSLSLSLARAALESKDTGVARAAADLARKSAPSSWEPIFWQARAQLAEEHATEAARLFEEAAARGGRAASDLLDLQLYSALALEKLGRAPEAIARLEALRQAHSGSRLVLAELARLLAGDAARLPPIASALARIDEQEASVRTLEAALASRALEESGPLYLDLAKAHLALQDPRAFDELFLAADLLPENAEVCRLLLTGMRQDPDVFVRIRYLRRLLDLEPRDAPSLGSLAQEYIGLHVRLDEARTLAERLRQVDGSTAAFRLGAQAELLLGRRREALALLEDGLARQPGDPALTALKASAEAAR